jgi:hypothetical protein
MPEQGAGGGGLATALSPSIFGRLVSPISISFILLTTYLQPHFFYLPASLKTNLILLTLLYETLCTIVLSISNGKSWLYWALKILSNWNSCNSQRVDKNYPNFQSCSKGTTFLLNVYLSPIHKKIDIFRLIFFFFCTILQSALFRPNMSFFPSWCSSASCVYRKYEDIRYFVRFCKPEGIIV